MRAILDEDHVMAVEPPESSHAVAMQIDSVRLLVDRLAETVGFAGDGACSAGINTVDAARTVLEAALKP